MEHADIASSDDAAGGRVFERLLTRVGPRWRASQLTPTRSRAFGGLVATVYGVLAVPASCTLRRQSPAPIR